jgi:hypothetical protein
MSEPFAKQLYKMLDPHHRDVCGNFESVGDNFNKLAMIIDGGHYRLGGVVNRRDRRLLIGFAASAAVAVGSEVFSCLETKKIQHLVLEKADNNVLITPNGKDYYTINE